MPPEKPHHTITDTGDLSDPPDQAKRCWPEVSHRNQLLLKLMGARRDAIEEEEADRAHAVKETASALTGVYEPDELERLREDWPE